MSVLVHRHINQKPKNAYYTQDKDRGTVNDIPWCGIRFSQWTRSYKRNALVRQMEWQCDICNRGWPNFCGIPPKVDTPQGQHSTVQIHNLSVRDDN